MTDSQRLEPQNAVVTGCVFMLVASLPALLGYNFLSDVRLIRGMDILDTENFIVSSLLPIQ